MIITWNKTDQPIKGTIIEDIINGFWEVSENIYYDNLAKEQENQKYRSYTR